MKNAPLALALAVLLAAAPAVADERIAVCADAAERGQELGNAHRPVEARAQFLICAQKDCPAVVRDSCTEWLASLARVTPTIVAGAKDEQGHDLSGVSVTLDGAALPENVTSTAVPVNPGSHVLRWSAAGHAPYEETVVVREGEPVRVLSVTLRRTALAPPPSAPAPPRALPVVPIVLGAASVVALSIFGVAAIKGSSDYRELEGDCGPRCSPARIDGVRSTFLVADVALVAGLVTAGAALTVWLLGRPPNRAVAPARSEARAR